MKFEYFRFVFFLFVLTYLTFAFLSFIWKQENIFPVYMKVRQPKLNLKCLLLVQCPLALSLVSSALQSVFNIRDSLKSHNKSVLLTMSIHTFLTSCNLLYRNPSIDPDKLILLTCISSVFLFLYWFIEIFFSQLSLPEVKLLPLWIVTGSSSLFLYLNLKSFTIFLFSINNLLV